MGVPVVAFDQVWKKFRRGERHNSLRDLIPSLTRRLIGRDPLAALEGTDDFWALKNVSFEVFPGEALGIIGPNGGGKSTTLKLLTKILRPNRGRSDVRGRVGALIEVAAGFHPDLTGRENIFLQGAIMGMRRPDILRHLDAIVEFAGVSEFIDTPVKRYSSGMNARLGFSIAAHLNPDVLIIDEVLSVGDMAFQQRCVQRMDDFRRSGIAIVFVSHDMGAVSRLCGRSLFLNRQVRAAGPTSDVISAYLHDANRHGGEDTLSGEIVIERTLFLGTTSNEATIVPGRRVTVRIECLVKEAVQNVTFGLVLFRSTDMLTVYDGNFLPEELGIHSFQPGMQFSVDFEVCPWLTRGQYHFQFHVYHNPTQTFVSKLAPAATLRVDEDRTFAGVVDLATEARATVSGGSVEPDAERFASREASGSRS